VALTPLNKSTTLAPVIEIEQAPFLMALTLLPETLQFLLVLLNFSFSPNKLSLFSEVLLPTFKVVG
jgi:hypothetical protein